MLELPVYVHMHTPSEINVKRKIAFKSTQFFHKKVPDKITHNSFHWEFTDFTSDWWLGLLAGSAVLRLKHSISYTHRAVRGLCFQGPCLKRPVL